ncbi:integrase domain-containing protein [Halomonas janggokensis]|uniref:Integrase domain-containing protein n=1 Tax=Vreelandella janggokensis TaxID=370767 RepID=A0ABT4IZ20_9GAMM|nr:integrase domain-containing protein [Halomonas janggokensis]MCZ0928700.1 integrase domain-containing protein [Halomonas janggokensis]MCZ0931435.1 integrase domain-containing protein [Halomonas janggokensis]
MAVPRGYAGWSLRKRNFGYGRRLGYAALSALNDRYGCKDHFQTRHSHHARFANFVRWIREDYDIRDARKITQVHMLAYAEYLHKAVNDDDYSVDYAQNLLSTVNVVMRCLRHDQRLYVSPSKMVGRRSHIRKTEAEGQRFEDVEKAVNDLAQTKNPRAAAMLLLGRAFGMRAREASLADLVRLLSEAQKNGECRILEGTKGGRRCDDRCIPMGKPQWRALEFAIQHSPDGSTNLLHKNETYQNFKHGVIDPGRIIIKAHGLISYREMRAAFAIETYEQKSEQPAPIKQKPVNLEAHLEALKITSKLMGHARPNSSRSYVG